MPLKFRVKLCTQAEDQVTLRLAIAGGGGEHTAEFEPEEVERLEVVDSETGEIACALQGVAATTTAVIVTSTATPAEPATTTAGPGTSPAAPSEGTGA
jgi:hypothetical protein